MLFEDKYPDFMKHFDEGMKQRKETLANEHAAKTILIDPAEDNKRAIRCYDSPCDEILRARLAANLRSTGDTQELSINKSGLRGDGMSMPGSVFYIRCPKTSIVQGDEDDDERENDSSPGRGRVRGKPKSR